MPTRAVAFLAAFDAAAAVAGAQVTELRAEALAVFVALVANRAAFVAAVRVSRAIDVVIALAQAAIGKRVAAEIGGAIAGLQAGHAAVPDRLTARQTVDRAIGVAGALGARAIRTMQWRGTARQHAAHFGVDRCASACASAAARCHPAEGPTTRGLSAGGGGCAGCWLRARRAARARHIEVEAIVARWRARYQQCGGHQRRARRARASPRPEIQGAAHGWAVSCCASLMANPCG